MTSRILIIGDDTRLAGMVSDYLGGAGYRVAATPTAREGEQRLKRESFDALILDLMLPDADGLEVCRRIRQSSDVPILMLTARGDAMDRVVGLEIGADDYLPKPFEPRELLARLRSILRRKSGPAPQDVKRYGRLEIDRARAAYHRRRGARSPPVRPARRARRACDRVMSRDALVVPPGRAARSLRPLGRRTSRASAAIERPKKPRRIITVRAGYVFAKGRIAHSA